MDLDILQEIREMIHGLGEKKPRVDTVKILQSVLLKQLTLLIYKIQQVANKDNGKILIKHIIYVLKDYKYTIIRLLMYYLAKENINKYSTSGFSAKIDQECFGNNTKKIQFNDENGVETLFNFDQNYDTEIFDPIKVLTSIDFKSKCVKKGSRGSVYNHIINSLKEFKPDLKITKEDIINSTIHRQIRVNELSLVLSPKRYEEFGYCRRKTFLNKTGDFLLHEVHRGLPFDIFYTKDTKTLILVLAKETLACLFDRLCKNRIFEDEALKYEIIIEEQDAITKASKHDSILVHEIALVIKSIWKESFEDICFSYKENNKFFANKLIFD